MPLSFSSETGKTYTVDLRLQNSATATVTGLAFPELGATGNYYLDDAALGAAGLSAVGAYSTTVKEGATAIATTVPPLFWNGSKEVTALDLSTHDADDVWSVSTRGVTEAVTTDAASRTASQANLTALSAAVGNIPTDPLLASNYVVPDNAGITTLTTRLTGTRAQNLDTVARTATADDYKANTTALATIANQSALSSSIASIPTNPLLASNYVAPDNTGIADAQSAAEAVETALTAARLAKLDLDLAHEGNAAPFQADLSGVLSAVAGVQTAILAEGVNWESADTASLGTSIAAIQALLDELKALATADETKAGTQYVKTDRSTSAVLLTKTVTNDGAGNYTVTG